MKKRKNKVSNNNSIIEREPGRKGDQNIKFNLKKMKKREEVSILIIEVKKGINSTIKAILKICIISCTIHK
jgi:hypothetical protein